MDSVKYNSLLNEKIYFKRLSTGMKCYIIPKKGYVEKQAMLAVNYGSADNCFKHDGEKYSQPLGIAHFLEHKMFENKKINVFEEFMKLGGSVNAFTNFTNTAYYFSCNENFYKNLRLLLKFTERPYFTEENVEKEKPIIAQEIEMYEDNPFWVVYLNLLSAMYENCPIKHNIAGSVESIGAINKELLLECYNAFYRPDNKVLVCVGEIEPEWVVEEAEECVSARKPRRIERVYGKEPKGVVKNYAEKSMALARPMFQLGFKDTDFGDGYAERLASTKILLDMVAGESSKFFEGLYSDGLIDGPFVLEYMAGSFYGTLVCSNTSDRPREVANRFLGELARIKHQGLDEQRFAQIKSKHIGRFVRSFNSIETLAHGQMELSFKGLDLFDIMKSYESVNFSQVSKRLANVFKEDNYVTSVVSPEA